MRTEILPFGIETTIVHPGDFHTGFAKNRTCAGNTVPGSPYYDAFQRTREFYDAMEGNAPLPGAVARRVERLLSMRRRLPVRSLVGAPLEVLGVWGKQVLPSRTFEYLFRKSYGPQQTDT